MRIKVEDVQALMKLDHIPKLEECNLKVIQQFYDEFISKYIYLYKLKNGMEIKIRFYKENLPHLLGIQKVVQKNLKKLYQGQNGYNRILTGEITIEKLESMNKQLSDKDKKLKEITPKITCFHLIPKLLNDCKIIKFYPERVKGNCSIKSEFILFDEQLGIRLHLGVLKDTQNSNIYVPETFIPKGGRDRDKDRLTTGQEYKSVIERDKILICD